MADSWVIKTPHPQFLTAMGTGSIDDYPYFVGGAGQGGTTVGNLWRYNPNSNIWTARASHPEGRANSPAVAVVDGILYAIGNFFQGTLARKNYAYNPSTNTWSARADAPELGYGGVTGVFDGAIHIVNRHEVPGGAPSLDHSVYHPSTNTWSARQNPPIGLFHYVGGTIERNLYIFGKVTGSFVYHHSYNPDLNVWTARPTPSPRNQNGFFGGTIARKLFVIGGIYTRIGHATQFFRTNEEYDAVTELWTTRASMPTARSSAAVGITSKRLYVVGGRVGSNIITRANEEYTPMGIGGYVHRWTGSNWQEEEVSVYDVSIFVGPYWRRGEVYVWSNGQWVLSS